MKITIKIILSGIILIGIFIFFSALIPSREKAKAQNTIQYPFGFANPGAPDNLIKLGALNFKYVRGNISWQQVEPTDNVFDFSIFDESGLVEQYGLELIARLKLGNNATFETANWWGTSCDLTLCDGVTDRECPSSDADCPPTDIDSQAWDSNTGYSPTVTDIITKTFEEVHSRGKNIEYIIVGNEVNSWVFWHGTAEQYLKTRATIYNAVKKVNVRLGTSYKVVDNGIASIWGNAIIKENFCSGNQAKINYAVEFANRFYHRRVAGDITQSLLANYVNCMGSRDYQIMKAMFLKDQNLGEPSFDLMAFHFYDPWDTLEESINWINNEMLKNGYQPRPIINTEGGYYDTLHVPSDETTKQDVANEIPKLHIIAFQKGVKAWLWLPFTERDSSYKHYGLEWKGLIGEDQSELPAYNSYKTMVAKINGFSSIDRLNVPTSNYVYKANFIDKNPVYIVWDKSSKTVDLSSLISGDVLVTHVSGQTEIVPSQNLDVSSSPIYIEQVPSSLSLNKSVDKSSALFGETLTYTISYTNSGSEVVNTKIEDSIPVGTTFVGASSGGLSDGTKVTWNLGTIAPGTIGIVSFQVMVQ